LGVTPEQIWTALGPFLESVRPWISPVALCAILGLVVRWQYGIRKLRIEARRVEITGEEVVHKDEADIRDHYAEEVRQLRERLDAQAERHRVILAEAEDRHEQCKRERDDLRDDSRKLKDIVAGLIRIITQASASKAILLDSAASAYVRDAALRIDMLFEERRVEESKE
jgi:hypothetical protein